MILFENDDFDIVLAKIRGWPQSRQRKLALEVLRSLNRQGGGSTSTEEAQRISAQSVERLDKQMSDAHSGDAAENQAVVGKPEAPTAQSRTAEELPEAKSEESAGKVSFYSRILRRIREDETTGYGPNWSNVDDYDIPSVLRKQMD